MDRRRFPEWLRRPLSDRSSFKVRKILRSYSLNTVCESAVCPNRNECFSSGRATFMIMGNVCTRNCAFCAVPGGVPVGLDDNEPVRIAGAVREMKLKHVVITSVTRDDLDDGGAFHYSRVIIAVREAVPKVTIEVLTPDFKGNKYSLDILIKSGVDVFNHNIETVPSLYSKVRPQADYEVSLKVLSYAAKFPNLMIKSGIMLGLGEKKKEVVKVLSDLYNNGVRILTVGQYLQPKNNLYPVAEYVPPEIFKQYAEIAYDIGFNYVFSSPYVRSSYNADIVFTKSGGMK